MPSRTAETEWLRGINTGPRGNRSADLLEKVQDETYWRKKSSLDRIERAQKADQDSERKERLKQSLCKYCFYLQGEVIAGAAITKTNCVICEDVLTFGSTSTDKICTKCAKKYRLCRHCLSDIDFKTRRKI